MWRKLVSTLILSLGLTSIGFSQYYTLNLDTQSPAEQPVIDRAFAGNSFYVRAYIYDSGVPIDLSSWTVLFRYSYGQFDTNGMVTIPGTVYATNRVDFATTNIFAKPYDNYYWSVSGSDLSGHIKTFGVGTMKVAYDPATSTNLVTLMQQINMDFGSNNIGAQVESNRVAIALQRSQFDATSNQFNNAITSEVARATAAELVEMSRATNAETIISNSLVIAINAEMSRATNAEATVSNYVNTAVAVETTRATNAEAVLQGEITAMTLSSNTIFRSIALSNGNTRVESLASGLGVTAALVGTEITMTIPAGVHIFSLMIKWDTPNNGSSFTLDMGVTDMTNDDVADRWNALFQAYTDDNGQLIAGANCKMDTANLSKLIIQGLQTRCINHCRFGF